MATNSRLPISTLEELAPSIRVKAIRKEYAGLIAALDRDAPDTALEDDGFDSYYARMAAKEV